MNRAHSHPPAQALGLPHYSPAHEPLPYAPELAASSPVVRTPTTTSPLSPSLSTEPFSFPLPSIPFLLLHIPKLLSFLLFWSTPQIRVSLVIPTHYPIPGNPLSNPWNQTDLDNKGYFYSAPRVVNKIHTALFSLSSPTINEERHK